MPSTVRGVRGMTGQTTPYLRKFTILRKGDMNKKTGYKGGQARILEEA